MATSLNIPVLIVGGGPVGLTAALLLSRYGVKSLLVERHPGTSLRPKARLVNGRTMEVFRHGGIEQAVREAGLPPDQGRYLIRAWTLAGPELERRLGTFTNMPSRLSPTSACTCAQEVLEPVLVGAVRHAGLCDVRFHCEVQALDQNASGVTATLVDRSGGDDVRVHASYVIAADGTQSGIRDALGIPMDGKVGVSHEVQIVFTADLSAWVTTAPFFLCMIEHPEALGMFAVVNGTDRWAFQARYRPDQGQTVDEFTPARCREVLRTAIGIADVPVEILARDPYITNVLVARQYRAGGVFLAGDAAHEVNPSGGFGMNVGIQDAHNLAWKLAAVLTGWAAPALLDTYETERRPVGQGFTERSLRNAAAIHWRDQVRWRDVDEAMQAGAHRDTRPELVTHHEYGLIYGALYESAAVVTDGTPVPASNPVTDYLPTGRPGGRAPHVWLTHHGERISTLDLCDAGFVLLTGRTGGPWVLAAEAVSHTLGVPLQAYVVALEDGESDRQEPWTASYGVYEDGAVLVRPDGYVAWRARSMLSHPEAALNRAAQMVVGRA
jgi:putative polyketide hydroxylase